MCLERSTELQDHLYQYRQAMDCTAKVHQDHMSFTQWHISVKWIKSQWRLDLTGLGSFMHIKITLGFTMPATSCKGSNNETGYEIN